MSVTEEWTEIYVKGKETPCTELKIGLQRLTDLCHGSCDLWVRWGFDFSVGSSCQSVLTCTEMEYLNRPPPENTPRPSEALSTAGHIHPRWADRTGDWSILSNIGWQDLRWVCVPLRLGRFVWRGRIKQSKQDRGAHGAQRRRENIWGKERRASNRDIDLSAHGPHVWQLNRQHDWLHEGGIFGLSMENSFSEEGMTERRHEVTGSYHNRVQGCQTTDICKEKKSSRSNSIKDITWWPEYLFFPIGMNLLFTIKSNVVMLSLKSLFRFMLHLNIIENDKEISSACAV